MRLRLLSAVSLVVMMFLVAHLSGSRADTPPVISASLPFGKSAWDLSVMDKDPVHLIKADYDQKANAVTFLLEFRRDLAPFDIEWKSDTWRRDGDRFPPFWFRFVDADGVVIRTEQARFDGEMVEKKGRRMRVFLELPSRDIMSRTKSVLVDLKVYGEQGKIYIPIRPEPEPLPPPTEHPERREKAE
jgi:hypothetical protein